MRTISLWLTAAVLVTAGLTTSSFAGYGGVLSGDARAHLEKAGELRAKGNRAAAMAVLESLLMGTARVGVTEDARPADRDVLEEAILRSISVWDNSIDDSPFVAASKTDRVDISVRFVDEIDTDGPDAQAELEAHRDFYYGKTHGFRLTAQILVARRIDGRLLTRDELTGILTHELGHLLGLDDDSALEGVMGPFVPGHPRLEPIRSEVNTVRQYRTSVRQSLRDLAKA